MNALQQACAMAAYEHGWNAHEAWQRERHTAWLINPYGTRNVVHFPLFVAWAKGWTERAALVQWRRDHG